MESSCSYEIGDIAYGNIVAYSGCEKLFMLIYGPILAGYLGKLTWHIEWMQLFFFNFLFEKERLK